MSIVSCFLTGSGAAVAHLVWDQGVAGSNPVSPTNSDISNFQGKGFARPPAKFFLKGIENCFALLAEVRRAETRSGAIRAFPVQKRFELRSVIATTSNVVSPSWIRFSVM